MLEVWGKIVEMMSAQRLASTDYKRLCGTIQIVAIRTAIKAATGNRISIAACILLVTAVYSLGGDFPARSASV